MAELIDKMFDIVEHIARAGHCSLTDLAAACDLPPATAYRIVTSLVRRGYMISERRGRYRIGAAWLAVSGTQTLPALIADVSRRPLQALAKAAHAHTHLAILDGDMVTYLIKQRYGRVNVHSQEQMQLEAYCTAIGKTLLGYLEPAALDAYLSAGPFVQLTPRTITDIDAIRQEVGQARQCGWATEIEETAPHLMCLATPILDRSGVAQAAISVSVVDPHPTRAALLERLTMLRDTRAEIEDRVFPGGA